MKSIILLMCLVGEAITWTQKTGDLPTIRVGTVFFTAAVFQIVGFSYAVTSDACSAEQWSSIGATSHFGFAYALCLIGTTLDTLACFVMFAAVGGFGSIDGDVFGVGWH
jgi:hypothetical protein